MQSWMAALKVELDRRCRSNVGTDYPGLWFPLTGTVAWGLVARANDLPASLALLAYSVYLIALALRLGSGCFKPPPPPGQRAAQALAVRLLAGIAPLLVELAIVLPATIVVASRWVPDLAAAWTVALAPIVCIYLLAAASSLTSATPKAAVWRSLCSLLVMVPALMIALTSALAIMPDWLRAATVQTTAGVVAFSFIPTLMLASILKDLEARRKTGASQAPVPATLVPVRGWDLARPVLHALFRLPRPTLRCQLPPGFRVLKLVRPLVALSVFVMPWIMTALNAANPNTVPVPCMNRYPIEQTAAELTGLFRTARDMAMFHARTVTVSCRVDDTQTVSIDLLDPHNHSVMEEYQPEGVTVTGLEGCDARHPLLITFQPDGKATIDDSRGYAYGQLHLAVCDPDAISNQVPIVIHNDGQIISPY